MAGAEPTGDSTVAVRIGAVKVVEVTSKVLLFSSVGVVGVAGRGCLLLWVRLFRFWHADGTLTVGKQTAYSMDSTVLAVHSTVLLAAIYATVIVRDIFKTVQITVEDMVDGDSPVF